MGAGLGASSMTMPSIRERWAARQHTDGATALARTRRYSSSADNVANTMNGARFWTVKATRSASAEPTYYLLAIRA